MGNVFGNDELDKAYTHVVYQWVMAQDNKSELIADFSKPYIRGSLIHIYPLYIFLYSIIFLFGTFGNLFVLGVIMRKRLYKNPMYLFLGNIAFSDLFMSMIILPITVANLLIENWIFGSLMCYLLPMMHCVPTHASMLTYLMIAVDRYRYIVHPMKSRVPTG